MQVVGFQFKKISAHKSDDFKSGPININVEFTDLQKEKLDLLRDSDAAKLLFRFSLEYFENKEDQDKKDKKGNDLKLAEIVLDGQIRLSFTKDESKDLMKAWKKKQLPAGFRIPLQNLILKKTASRAMQLQDELDLPSHVPIQQIKPNN